MADSIREQIMKKVVLALQGIVAGPTYNNSVGLVTRFINQQVNLTTVPVLYVQQGEEDAADIANMKVDRFLTVRILIIHRHDPDAVTKSTDEVLNSIEQDIYKAIMANYRWDELALKTDPGGVKSTEGVLEELNEHVKRLLEFQIHYRHSWLDEAAA